MKNYISLALLTTLRGILFFGITFCVFLYIERRDLPNVKSFNRMQWLVSTSGLRFDHVESSIAPMVCVDESITNLVSYRKLQDLNHQVLVETKITTTYSPVRVREGYAELRHGKYTLMDTNYSPPFGYYLAVKGKHNPVIWRLSM